MSLMLRGDSSSVFECSPSKTQPTHGWPPPDFTVADAEMLLHPQCLPCSSPKSCGRRGPVTVPLSCAALTLSASDSEQRHRVLAQTGCYEVTGN